MPYVDYCEDIAIDPYTNNIWLCCREGFIIYNRDSIWFDIREYTPDYAVEEKLDTRPVHDNNLNVFPNPSKGIFNILPHHDEDIFIYDISGRIIDVLPKGQTIWLPQNIPTGTYLFGTQFDKDERTTTKVRLVN